MDVNLISRWSTQLDVTLKFRRKSVLIRARYIFVVGILTVFALYKQPYWPPTWIDEGFTAQGAINLVRHAQYAMRSSEGFRVLDQPLVANGPGIVLPLAAMFNLFGVGLMQARLVAALFMIATGLLFYITAQKFGGVAGGALALALLLAMPHENFVYFGRMAMGNVASLAYFFVGSLIWASGIERRKTWLVASAGLFFGLAAITKGQWSIVLFPALMLVWLADLLFLRRIGWRLLAVTFVAVAIVLAAWYGARWIILGSEALGQHLEAIQSSARWTVTALNPVLFGPRSVTYLIRSGVGLVGVVGLIYAIWLIVHRHPQAALAALFASISFVWLIWYVLVSVGWERYAFGPFVLSCLLAGGALVKCYSIVRSPSAMGAMSSLPARVLLGGTLVLTTAFAGVHMARQLGEWWLRPIKDTSAQDIAQYLNNHIPTNQIIESWEWQLGLLTEHDYHYPENIWVDRYTAYLFAHEPLDDRYDFTKAHAQYLIDGPFSKFTGIYAEDIAKGCCELLISQGAYDLYRVSPR